MDRRVEAGLVRLGFDVLSVTDAGRRGLSDEEQLSFAAETDRTIFTGYSADFPGLHWAWMAAGRSHAGIIVLSERRLGVGVQIRALEDIDRERGEEGMRNHLEFIGRGDARPRGA